MDDFVNLRVFSHYSRFESILKPRNIIDLAKKKGEFAVGICDRMNLFGVVEFSKMAVASGVKPIIGCLLEVENYGQIPVFIKDSKGFSNLSEALSKVYIQHRTQFVINELDQLKGLIVLSGSVTEKLKLDRLKAVFGKDFYIEIKNYNSQLMKYALEEEVSIVFTSEVRYGFPEDEDTYTVFKSIDKDGNQTASPGCFMKKRDDFPEKLRIINEGFFNSVRIAKICNFVIEPSDPLIPKFNDIKEKDDEMLRVLAVKGLKKKLRCNEIPETYMKRLDHELDVLQLKGFSGYFLVTADFINFAKRSNIPVGPGRGSGAGCLTAYGLDITDLDPIEYNLIFERFINPERMSMPDFDIDFCPFRREEVINYLTDKYGPYNVVHIITFGTLQTRAVLKDVARVFNISFNQINNIIKYIPNNPAKPITLGEALEIVPQLKELEKDEKFQSIFKHAKKLEGLMRNYSKHAAGVIIMDRPVYKVCPLFREGDLVTQFNLNDAEYVGCVKFDLLGLKTLTIIQKTIELIHKNFGIEINEREIPLNDEKTYELLRNGNLEGVFQFDGSAGIKASLVQLKPDSINDLTAMTSLYRPGPIDNLPNYIRRKHGKEEISYLHELTIPILKETYGIMVYQEQVMDIARICAGYSLGQADLLRRAMGKKKPEEMKKQKEIFLEGCAKNHIEKSISEKLFEEMSEFAGYAFNKSHAAAYSIISYQCAYLKANYPKEFLAVCMSLDKTDGEKLARYLYSAKDLGVSVLPPSISKSSTDFSIENNSIRYGLSALKNISEDSALAIFENGPYKDIYEFVYKNKNIINKKVWDSLVGSGSLDLFGFDRAQLINNLETLRKQEDLPNEFEVWTTNQKQEMILQTLGFYLESPAGHWNKELRVLGCSPLNNRQNELQYVAMDILSLKKRRKSNNEIYAIAQVCDGNRMIDVMIFSRLWVEKAELLERCPTLVFCCVVKGNLNVKSIFTIDEILTKPHKIKIYVENRRQIDRVRSILEACDKGNCKVIFALDDQSIESDFSIKDSTNFRELISKINIKITTH